MILLLFVATAACAPPVFVVNLAHRTDRMEAFAKQAAAAGLSYTRIEAVDAAGAQRALDDGTVALNGTFRDPTSNRPIKLGEVGCSLSHLAAWAEIAKLEPAQYAVVLEDDAQLRGYTVAIDDVVAAAADNDAEFVYLAYRQHGRSGRKPVGSLLQTCEFNYWTIAYLLRADAARRLVAGGEAFRRNMVPVDEYLPIVLGVHDGEPAADEPVRLSCEPELGCKGAAGGDPRYADVRLACLTVRTQLVEPKFDKAQSDTETSDVAAVAPDRRLAVLTVATDTTHYGYVTLARSARYFGYDLRTLGTGDEWHGGDMVDSTGGGQKLLLVRKALAGLDAEQLVLFTDGYDTVFQLGPDDLLRRWKAAAKTTDVLFGAEKLCWPSRDLCTRYEPYLSTKSPFRYLNSGTYIGRAKHLRALLDDADDAEPATDDQLFFSRKLLASLKGTLDVRVALDTDCEVFQPLADTTIADWECESPAYLFRNAVTGSTPALLHGNGRAKRTFVGLSNYAAGAYSDFYETTRHTHNDTAAVDRLALGLFFTGTPFEREFVEAIERLELDRAQTDLFAWYGPGSRLRLHHELRNSYRNFAVPQPDDEALARAAFLVEAARMGASHALMIDSDVIVRERRLVQQLAGWDVNGIVAGHARREIGLWSNFWTDMRDDGWYRRGFDTTGLYRRNSVGLFQVPFARGLLLLRNDSFARTAALYRNHEGAGDDSTRRVCVDALNTGLPVYVDNRLDYALLLGEEHFTNPAAPHPELYEAHRTPSLWAGRYLVSNWTELQFDEPCTDAYGAVLFTEAFADELRATVIAADSWSSGKNDDERIQGGYENVPTQDIHMNQFDWEEQWVYVLGHFIRPLVERQYRAISFKAEINIAFVVRYSMAGQRDLRPHNDASQVTTTVILNSEFEGGGVQFTRYNCSHVSRTPGFLLMHPGRVTHNHLAYPITSGTRYVLVSFNE